MSSNKTTNFQLHAWEGGDNFLLSEFNENFGAIDTALGAEETRAKAAESALDSAKADKSTVTALTTTVGTKAAQSDLNTLTQTVNGKADSGTVTALQSIVAGKADSGTVSALQAVVAGKVEVVFGNYVGDNQSSRIISLGFTPRAVLVSGHSNTFIANGIAYGGFALSGSLGGNTGTTLLNVVTGGFQVFDNSISLNGKNYKYSYMAVR